MTLHRAKLRRGAATIEYALFLALVAGGIVLAADTVSFAMRSSFEETSLALEPGVKPRHLPVEDVALDRDLVSDLVAPGGDSEVRPFQFAAVAGSLFCGALVWYGLYCRRTHFRIDRAHDVTEQLNELPPELGHDDLFSKRQQILCILSNEMVALLESRLEVRHLMSRRVVSVKPNVSREEVLARMEEHQLRHMLVCDDDAVLIGLISDRDLKSRSGDTAKQLMTTELITVEPQALVNPAITLMINRQISCLPVVRDGSPIGVLTSTDLMMALQCSMQVLTKVASEVRRKEPSGATPASAPVGGVA